MAKRAGSTSVGVPAATYATNERRLKEALSKRRGWNMVSIPVYADDFIVVLFEYEGLREKWKVREVRASNSGRMPKKNQRFRTPEDLTRELNILWRTYTDPESLVARLGGKR